MRAITRGVQALTLANNIEGGKSPILPADELQAIGYSVVVFPVAATYAVTKVVVDLMAEIKSTGTSAGFRDRMFSFEQFNKFIGLAEMLKTERGFSQTDDPPSK